MVSDDRWDSPESAARVVKEMLKIAMRHQHDPVAPNPNPKTTNTVTTIVSLTKNMSQQNLETLEQETRPQTNYIKFMSGEKKILIFASDEEHAHMVEDERFGKRVRFVVVDVTDPVRPVEGRIWDTSFRWARIIINYLKKNQECLEIERQGTGTGTNYMIIPASRE